MADLAELQAVLEEAAVALRSAFDDHQTAAATLWSASQSAADAEKRADAKTALQTARRAGIELTRPLQRLAIRLDGKHPAARAFVQAMYGHQARVHDVIEVGPERYTERLAVALAKVDELGALAERLDLLRTGRNRDA